MSHTITSRVCVLAITPYDTDLQALSRIFSHTAWDLTTARNLSEALNTMHITPAPVVLTEATLPDASWKDVLAEISTLSQPPNLVVASAAADDCLWAEALNLGAYDVIAKPFRSNEVFRIIGLAWRNWIDLHRTRAAAAAASSSIFENSAAS